MKYYAGLDVSLDSTAVCVLDLDGEIVCETSVVSHADDIFSALSPYLATLEGIGLEAGPLSEFLVCGLKTKGVHAILMETRRVHAALSAIPVKTDRKDACGIAHLLRMGWYQPVHLKTPAARDLRMLLSARDTLGRRLRDLDNSIRGLLRGFGLRFPVGVPGQLCALVRDLIDGNPVLIEAIAPLLAARDAIS